MEHLFKILEGLIDPTLVIIVIAAMLFANAWIFKKLKTTPGGKGINKGAITFFIVFLGLLGFILTLPIKESLKGQILSFLGIIISAGIALSSTTVLGNLIAGIMNNSMNRFKNGDLIKIGDFNGRVTQKNIFHTEIQLEDSNFITIPNLFIATNPVKLIRKTNTVISATVSLGYDVPRDEIEKALKEAASDVGLKDPYVYITALGDHSVVYKVHGFLEDSSKYFSTNSLLNAKVMDSLHKAKIEIVSPTFMNQRQVNDKEFIPKGVVHKEQDTNGKSPEELIFDEAIKSEKIEQKKKVLQSMDDKREELKEKLKQLEDKEEIEKMKSMIKRNEELRDRIEANIKEQVEKNKNDER